LLAGAVVAVPGTSIRTTYAPERRRGSVQVVEPVRSSRSWRVWTFAPPARVTDTRSRRAEVSADDVTVARSLGRWPDVTFGESSRAWTRQLALVTVRVSASSDGACSASPT
jgi:hypothetical protein